MSRIGRMPVAIPSAVNISISQENVVIVKGPKGELTQKIHPDIKVTVNDQQIEVARPSDSKRYRSLHGLSRSLIFNMVAGVTEGYQKKLEINGTGYRALKKGTVLVLTVGYSHPVEIAEGDGITFDVPEPTKITVKGIDKQKVGAVAAKIRSVRKPEPYKGKGIKYENERIIRKEGKAGASA